MGLLGLAMAHTSGPILEVGMGYCSTPMIHTAMLLTDRRVVSLEEDVKWIERLAEYRTQNHLIYHVARWEEDVWKLVNSQHWGVVLVDHELPGDLPAARMYQGRREFIRRLDPANVDLLLTHDTENQCFWEDADGLRRYKFHVTHKPSGLPWTTVSSNLPIPFEWAFFYGPQIGIVAYEKEMDQARVDERPVQDNQEVRTERGESVCLPPEAESGT
jgi:hypothetical protein